MILIVTNRQDQTADFLILELKRRKAEYLRFNTEDFPQRVSIVWELKNQELDGYLAFPNRKLQFSQIKSVWYRRPVNPIPNGDLDDESRNFVTIESLSTLDGLWRTLACFWVSKPDNIRIAENKLFQLCQAKQMGFQIPETIVTNDSGAAKAFYLEHGQDIIYKPLRKGRLDRGGNESIIFTNLVNHEAASQLDKVEYAPTLLQQYVHKQLELRITVIGEQVFAVSLDSQAIPEAKHDWRRALNIGINHQPYKLPLEIEEKCRIYVKKLGLEFGAIDMILTPEGQYVFLEINPNGQWAWIQQVCPGIPLREAFADLLNHG
jgi:glutathione synthase/RimK-type ligase-like ATP-grasp enzyme